VPFAGNTLLDCSFSVMCTPRGVFTRSSEQKPIARLACHFLDHIYHECCDLEDKPFAIRDGRTIDSSSTVRQLTTADQPLTAEMAHIRVP